MAVRAGLDDLATGHLTVPGGVNGHDSAVKITALVALTADRPARSRRDFLQERLRFPNEIQRHLGPRQPPLSLVQPAPELGDLGLLRTQPPDLRPLDVPPARRRYAARTTWSPARNAAPAPADTPRADHHGTPRQRRPDAATSPLGQRFAAATDHRPEAGTTHPTIIDGWGKSIELGIADHPESRPAQRTCYEPLASTRSDTQASPDFGSSFNEVPFGSSFPTLIAPASAWMLAWRNVSCTQAGFGKHFSVTDCLFGNSVTSRAGEVQGRVPRVIDQPNDALEEAISDGRAPGAAIARWFYSPPPFAG
jgi:hypothetical protein